MRSLAAAVVVLALANTISADIDASLLKSEAVQSSFEQLVARSGYGRFAIELGAFVRLLPDGTLTVEPWPADRHFQSTSFTGIIPDGTVAIAHTHPLRIPRPSRHDVDLAQRLGIPIVVLTPRAITVAQPDGRVVTLIHHSSWTK